jgi:hypothetical protein
LYRIQLFLDLNYVKTYGEHEYLRWGAAYSCMVLIDGCSNILHLDMSDAKQTLNFIIVFGDFKGGYLLLPQTGKKIYLSEGWIFAFCGSVLAHAAEFESGRRFCINAFTCHGTYAAARKFWERFGVYKL